MSENNKTKRSLNYEMDKEAGKVELELKFATPALRSKINDWKNKRQKALRKLAKELELSKFDEKFEKVQQELAVKGYAAEKIALKLATEHMSDEDSDQHKEIEEAFTHVRIKFEVMFLKLITKYKSLNNHHKKLWDQEYEEEFWQHVDDSEVEDINNFFRERYNIS